MAKAPKQPQQPEVQEAETKQPTIEFIGEGADQVQFEVDPKAKLMQVYSDGRILTHY